jgi:transcriptional regulator with XRE-family HTH domain
MMKTPLRKAREQAGLTIAELAAAAEVDRGNLSRIERGRTNASLESAERLAKVLGISELEILYPERYATTDSASQAA